ncbi:hypothetical protein [Ponticaulis sp.]|uniref:hypothetical protein n=1 Tax=Ponticaulis sp. TaxID=2020902 RepID=UPI000B763A24|nr:hypothetical protein [Ponticaulis sp.]MAJ09359.1 hypothetical protein [Ponticaulis sp.]RPG18712.1 MAG: hypothetical protein CBC85_000295 [Hyphomonadaceae bacterium TMED125]|tara:strand:- start:86 stop:985 length:900 start_codon:yes stop_codon:yes gene_type:complete
MPNNQNSEALYLCGYLQGWDSSFAIPFFGAGANPNNWYVMRVKGSNFAHETIDAFAQTDLFPNKLVADPLAWRFAIDDPAPRVLICEGLPIIGSLSDLYAKVFDDEFEGRVDDLALADISMNFDFYHWTRSIAASAGGIAKLGLDSALTSWMQNVLPRKFLIAANAQDIELKIFEVRPKNREVFICYDGNASFEDLDFFRRHMAQALKQSFSTMDFVANRENLMIELALGSEPISLESQPLVANVEIMNELLSYQHNFNIDGKAPIKLPDKQTYDRIVSELVRQNWTFNLVPFKENLFN